MKARFAYRCAAAAALAIAVGLSAGAAQAKDVVIHAGHLIDGVSAKPLDKMSILIRDDRITGVQKGFVTPAGAEVIDLSDATVLPGLIESHDHISRTGLGLHHGARHGLGAVRRPGAAACDRREQGDRPAAVDRDGAARRDRRPFRSQ